MPFTRSVSFKILLSAIILLVTLQTRAQTCNGSLGDPVINETFGAGSTFGTGPALPGTVTNYTYTSQSCPGDGFYTIETGIGTCFNAWDIVPHDHTGDKNGYMMVVNSSYAPGVFYTQKASGQVLCPNTTYEFAAWILNLIRGVNRPEIKPNITFSIETVSGRVLKTYPTGDIPSEEVATFHQYGTLFTTPATGEDIIVKMINNAPGGNGNDLVLDDITFRPCGPIITTGFGVLGGTKTKDQCEHENGNYTLKGSQVGYINPVYQWQYYDDVAKLWKDAANGTTTSLNVALPNATAGIYQYRLGVLEAGASINCRIYSAPLTINVNKLPVANVAATTTVCFGQELRLSATGGATYRWTGPNGYTSTDNSPLVSPSANTSFNGVYTVTVTSDKGCSTVASTTVTVLPKVQATVSGGGVICEGDETPLTATGGANYTYKWTPATGLDHDDIPNPIAKPAETTTYHLKIDNGACTDESYTVTVVVIKRPHADAGADVSIQEGESIQLNGTVSGDNVKFYWTPDGHIANALTPTPTVSPVENTTYTLHVESQDNCGVVTDDVFVRVFKKITIPNTFSPNNDGINDLWNIDQLSTYPESVLTVYTRSGSEVYHTTGYAKPWNGIFQGRQLPVGVYYYVIDLKNDTPKRSGWVMLVR
ncbi:T9SS type B sorting domain-containing protein [Inquilinus sp. KBS0705]|nr:T9SS type B sorting domain-containing protein [Inquilinus sp. KBS0705]